MPTLSVAASKVQLAIIRRLPFAVRSAYVPALRQTIREPGRASSVFSEIYWSNLYRPMHKLPSSPNIVDLGANMGLFSIYASQLSPDAKITAFEASPRVYPILIENLSRLRWGDVRPHNVAVTDREGSIDFQVDRNNPYSLEATAFRDTSTYADPKSLETISVPCSRLDTYVPGYIDFLKCDIEGAEYSAIGDTLTRKRVDQAVIEFHEIARNWDAFSDIVARARSERFAVLDRHEQPLTVNEQLRTAPTQNIVVKFCAERVS